MTTTEKAVATIEVEFEMKSVDVALAATAAKNSTGDIQACSNHAVTAEVKSVEMRETEDDD